MSRPLHPPRCRLLRRAAAALALLLLGASIAGWCFGRVGFDGLTYKWSVTRETPITPESPWPWSLTARSLIFGNNRGHVALASSRYESFAPARDELTGWDTWKGWEYTHAGQVGGRGAPPPPSTYWKSWDECGLLGLCVRKDGRQGSTVRFLEIPHWLLATLFAGVAVALVRPDIRRWRRRARGRCEHCGYDRGGLAPGAPCPECNAAGPASTPTSTPTSTPASQP